MTVSKLNYILAGQYEQKPKFDRAEVLALSPEERLERKRYFDRVKSKRHYHGNIDKARKTARDSAAKARQDPVKLAKIKARKRADGAGLSPEQINELRQTQENKCAICKSPDPTDLDHCHSSGVVRWLLCKHCNRGLGAFKDSPSLLRKAAELPEDLTTQKTP